MTPRVYSIRPYVGKQNRSITEIERLLSAGRTLRSEGTVEPNQRHDLHQFTGGNRRSMGRDAGAS